MATVLDDEFMVCSDCLPIIANGDYSHLDYSYDENEASEIAANIDAGIATSCGYIVVGDSSKDDEFSSTRCHCCGSHLAGSRHHCIVLGD